MQAATVQRIGVDNVYSDIQAFLNEYESEKTKKEYIRDIREFFMYTHGKAIEHLTIDNIIYVENNDTKIKLSKKHVIEYRNHLMNKNSDGTVNRKMISLKALYRFLQGEGYKVNYLIFALKALKYNPDSYEVLTRDQVINIAEKALEEEYGDQLHALIYLSTVTSFRIDAVLSIKPDDIRKEECGRFYTATVIDKRKQKRKMPLEQFLYDKLMSCKKDDVLFPNWNIDRVNKTIKKIAKSLGYSGRIVTHSLRKAAPAFEDKTTGDINQGMKQTGHKSVQTYVSTYVGKDVDYSALAGIRMFQEVKEEVLEQVDKNELLHLLKDINPAAYEQLVLKVQDVLVKNETNINQ